MTPKEKILKILYVVFLFLLSVGFIYWGLNGGGYWPLIIGVFFVVSFIANFLRVWYELKTNDLDEFLVIQACVGCLLPIALGVVVLFFRLDDTRYVSPLGDRLHILRDCPSLQSSTDVREVTKLEGWFHWTFQDCKVCTDILEKQKEEERKAEKLKQAESTRQELIEYYNHKISELQDILENLKTTDDPADIKRARRIMEDIEYTGDDDDDYEPEPRGRPDRL